MPVSLSGISIPVLAAGWWLPGSSFVTPAWLKLTLRFASLQRRGPSRKRPPIRAGSADEAIGKMLEQKKISSKINYDVLKDLNVKPSTSPAQSPKREAPASRITPRQRRPAPAPLTLSTPLSTLGKRWACPQRETFGGC